ncbi:serine/threonine protein kinase [Archangium violaceum]|uniref:serine/threonine-protein kinase n=1 Tax=Archangium violaceum TaxID=83451 RepID=UPI001951B5E6|nr:serine/threonine-protein kinase [Archangium violaceum]QRO00788.1 serine/threonine protein kinase [Archangium violaceum]
MDRVNALSPAPGEEGRFGKYRIIQQLASGGMAHIFLASIDGPDGFSKSCVIKRILPEYASLEAFSRMFADEAKVAALLTHPNIVQIFDFGKIDGQYYLAMEWIQGASLDRVLRHAWNASFTLGVRVAVDVGIAISSALAYAHSKTLPDGTPLRLVHRDITPGNVLVSRDGIIKLADFGIVKSTVNLERTVAGVVKGKYAYMSPEQISNRELDHRSDLFSLGIVLYEAATGSRLFKRDTIEATILATSHAEVPPPSQVTPGFPPALERILLRLLAKEPQARYQSAHEVHEDLEKFRASQQWTSGGRELAALMATLFPPDKAGRHSTAVPIIGSLPGSNGLSSGAGTGRTSGGSPGSRPPAPRDLEDEGTSPATSIEGATAAEQAGAEGFPWGIAMAAGVATIGSALFWYFVA